jgi:hypothetical protein
MGVTLMGTSEGAMSVSRFDDRPYGKLITGRIINAFACEYCYFTPTRASADLGGQLDVPTLNLIGTRDEFFGPAADAEWPGSIASHVAADASGRGWGEPISGNAYASFLRQGVKTALVATFVGAAHDGTEHADNAIRDVMLSFLAAPLRCVELLEQWSESAEHIACTTLKRRCVPEQSDYVVGERAFGQNPKYKDGTRLREQPHKDAPFLTEQVLYNDMSVEVLDAKDGWVRVRTFDAHGEGSEVRAAEGWLLKRNLTRTQRQLGLVPRCSSDAHHTTTPTGVAATGDEGAPTDYKEGSSIIWVEIEQRHGIPATVPYSVYRTLARRWSRRRETTSDFGNAVARLVLDMRRSQSASRSMHSPVRAEVGRRAARSAPKTPPRVLAYV